MSGCNWSNGFCGPRFDPLSLMESSCRCRSKCQLDCQVCNLGRDTCCCQVCAHWNSGSSRWLCFFGVSKSRLHKLVSSKMITVSNCTVDATRYINRFNRFNGRIFVQSPRRRVRLSHMRLTWWTSSSIWAVSTWSLPGDGFGWLYFWGWHNLETSSPLFLLCPTIFKAEKIACHNKLELETSTKYCSCFFWMIASLYMVYKKMFQVPGR